VVFSHGSVYERLAVWSSREIESFLLTRVHPRVRSTPLDVAARPDAIIKVVVRKDGSHLSIPWSTQSTLVGDVQRAVGLRDMTVVDVDAIFVLKSGVAALPRCDASTAAPELDLRVGDP